VFVLISHMCQVSNSRYVYNIAILIQFLDFYIPQCENVSVLLIDVVFITSLKIV